MAQSLFHLQERSNDFFKEHYHQFLWLLMGLLGLLILMLIIVVYEIYHRPLPEFRALQSDGQQKNLTAFEEPNLLPGTILRWASKAATIAYTFDFVNYAKQKELARPFFTPRGWVGYDRSVTQGVIADVIRNKLFVTSVVSGPPLIANQGDLPERGYTWRVQIPFIVTYQSANREERKSYRVTLMIVRVPTTTNPQGIGIDQFIME